jgi:D-3-phosphoglycerate dehydrogenase / 2-oxoglutarate reductase
MSVTRKLCLFEHWMDPVGSEFMAEHSPETDVSVMAFSDGEEINWSKLAEAHGHQMLPSTETPELFFPKRAFLERCPNLLAISSAGAGYDMADVEACTEAGILIFNQSGANAESVAQHALGMMLALCKNIIQVDRAIHRPQRGWTRMDFTGSEITGRTLGIVGLGNIGRRISAICGTAFNMRVIAYDPYITDQDFAERGAEKTTLEQVMSEADFVTIHCPLTEETTGMIGTEQFASMKPNSYFIATARGGIYDEGALNNEITSGRIAGAGLDVFVEEPPAHTHPLLAHDNVIVSPHNAGITTDCLYNMARSAAEQWVDVFASKRPRLLVNPDAWGKYIERHKRILGVEVKEDS